MPPVRFPLSVPVPFHTLDGSPLGPAARRVSPVLEAGRLPGVVTAEGGPDGRAEICAQGWRDLASGSPLRADSLFWIASTTKPVTAAAFMMLVEEGLASLDEPAWEVLPEFKEQRLALAAPDGAEILVAPPRGPTFRECLSHTGGCVFLSRFQWKHRVDALPLPEALTTYAMQPLGAAPGARYQYSNTGFQMAAAAIERRSGMPYWRYMQERLFNPLGMNDTAFWPTPEQLTRLATAYAPAADTDGEDGTGGPFRAREIDQLTYPLEDRTRRHPEAGGGLFSTAADVLAFFRMLARGGLAPDGRRVMAEASVREMRRKQTPEGVPDHYGLGLALSAERPDEAGHGGACGNQAEADFAAGRIRICMVQSLGLPGAAEAWSLLRGG